MYLLTKKSSICIHIGIFSDLKKTRQCAVEEMKKYPSTEIRYCIYQFHINNTIPHDHLVGSIEVNTAGEILWYDSRTTPLKLNPITEFAYAILDEDPIAVDAVKDILKL